jgi:hypothetical protein
MNSNQSKKNSNQSKLQKLTFIHKYTESEVVKLLKKYIELKHQVDLVEKRAEKLGIALNREPIRQDYLYWEKKMNKLFSELINIQEELIENEIFNEEQEIITEYGTLMMTPYQLKRNLELHEETYNLVRAEQIRMIENKHETTCETKFIIKRQEI